MLSKLRLAFQNSLQDDRFLVWGLFLVLAARLLYIISRLRYFFPCGDELYYVPLATGETPITFANLWFSANEHNMFLIKLLIHFFARATHYNLFWAAIISWAVLSITALLAILCVRILRGGQFVFTDAIIPLIFLNGGHIENLINFLQMQFLLPNFFIVFVIFAMVAFYDRHRHMTLLAAWTVFVLLPLSGGTGFIIAAALLLLLLGEQAIHGIQRSGGARLKSAILLHAGALLGGVYLVAVRKSVELQPVLHFTIRGMLSPAARYLTLWVGYTTPIIQVIWPALFLSEIAVCTMLILWPFLKGWRLAPAKMPFLALSAGILATIGQALAVGVYRGNACQDRYYTPAVMFVFFFYSLAVCADKLGIGHRTQIVVFFLVALSFSYPDQLGIACYKVRAELEEKSMPWIFNSAALVQDSSLVEEWWPPQRYKEIKDLFHHTLETLRNSGFCVYSRVHDTLINELARNAVRQSLFSAYLALNDGTYILKSEPVSTYFLPLAGNPCLLSFQYGMLDDSWSRESPNRTDGAVFRILVECKDGTSTEVWRRTLDPVLNSTDRKRFTGEIRINNPAASRVLFETLPGPTGNPHMDMCYWCNLKWSVESSSSGR